MHFSFDLHHWYGYAPNLITNNDWVKWANLSVDQINIDKNGALPARNHVPMLTARRMSKANLLAVEIAQTLLNDMVPDVAIFSSRHGELERTYRILNSLNQNADISPTDFALSVHNTASGLFTIIANKSIPVISLSRGNSSFLYSLIEAQALFVDYEKVLIIDFDGCVPNVYQVENANYPYAVGMIISKGNQYSCQKVSLNTTPVELPQSMAFLRHHLRNDNNFTLAGNNESWNWENHQ